MTGGVGASGRDTGAARGGPTGTASRSLPARAASPSLGIAFAFSLDAKTGDETGRGRSSGRAGPVARGGSRRATTASSRTGRADERVCSVNGSPDIGQVPLRSGKVSSFAPSTRLLPAPARPASCGLSASITRHMASGPGGCLSSRAGKAIPTFRDSTSASALASPRRAGSDGAARHPPCDPASGRNGSAPTSPCVALVLKSDGAKAAGRVGDAAVGCMAGIAAGCARSGRTKTGRGPAPPSCHAAGGVARGRSGASPRSPHARPDPFASGRRSLPRRDAPSGRMPLLRKSRSGGAACESGRPVAAGPSPSCCGMGSVHASDKGTDRTGTLARRACVASPGLVAGPGSDASGMGDNGSAKGKGRSIDAS